VGLTALFLVVMLTPSEFRSRFYVARSTNCDDDVRLSLPNIHPYSWNTSFKTFGYITMSQGTTKFSSIYGFLPLR
jgi:hypothetical protein